MNLPNSITLTRICSIPLLIWILSSNRFHGMGGEQELLASGLFIAASITDGIDGYLARKRGQITTMGILLDPLADKLLIAAAFVTLVQFNPSLVPAWMAVVIIGREFLVSGFAFDSRLRRLHHRSQRTGQVQNAGADCFRSGCGPRSSLEGMAGLQDILFPGALDRMAIHLVHGGPVADLSGRLLYCLLVENRPASREAAAPQLHSQPAEKT